MTDQQWEDLDLLTLINADPDIALTIVSSEGQIMSYSQHAPSVFGAIQDHDYRGAYLRDLFTPEFAEERLRWIRQAIEEERPIKAHSLYQGDRITSTIVPMNRDPRQPYVSVLTRRDRRDPSDAVQSDLLELEPLNQLTSRELEVLILLGHGYSVPETAKLLHRSPRTIEQHKANLGRKLGGSAIAEIARLVGQFGLRIDDLRLQPITALRPQFRDVQRPPTTSVPR